MKPFLILQLRSHDVPADNEFEAFMNYGGLEPFEVHRIRMEKESIADIDAADYSGIMVGGGPSNVSDPEPAKTDYQIRFENELNQLYDQIFAGDIPYLGSCYGLGSLAKYAGAQVAKGRYSEPVGSVEINLSEDGKKDPLLEDMDSQFIAFNGHKEAVQMVPENSTLLASSDECLVHMIRFKQNIYATQFHCELDAQGIGVRIQYYRNHGYFKPEAADDLIEQTKDVIVTVPQLILRRFVEKYRH